MPAAAEGIIRPPAEDQPALADPTTELLLNILSRQTKARLASVGYTAIYLVCFGWMLSFMVRAGFGAAVLVCAITGWLLLGTGRAVYAHVRLGRWLKGAPKLLEREPWRPVPAAVTEQGVIEVRDEGALWQLRMPRVYPAVREVIVRTGRVWMAGPDAKGWLTLRVDGAATPCPARRKPAAAAGVGREPVSPGTSGTAADDPVSALWAADVRRSLLLQRWPFAFYAVSIVTFAAGMAVDTHTTVRWLVFAAVFLIPCVSLLLTWTRRARDYLRLRELLAAGPWWRADVELLPWVAPRKKSATKAGGTVRLEDGTTLDIALPAASVPLLGTIEQTGAVWIAGDPLPGRTVAVGFPGYPLLGVAALS